MPDLPGTLKPPRLSSAPASPALGQLYYDTGTNILYWWNGTSWVSSAGAGAPPDATTSSKGIVQLAGDLAGTAASPQIAAGAIVNADVSASAALAYSKLALTGSIVDGDVAAANKDGVAATPSMRTLGTGAQQALAGNATIVRLITDYTHPGGTTVMTFSSIPGTYKHLLILCQLRNDQAVTVSGFNCRFNNDSGTNYEYMDIQTNRDGTQSIAGASAQTAFPGGICAGGNLNAAAHSTLEIFIPNYAGAKYKSAHASSWIPWASSISGATPMIRQTAGGWLNTAAITQIDLPGSGNWSIASRFTLYGVG